MFYDIKKLPVSSPSTYVESSLNEECIILSRENICHSRLVQLYLFWFCLLLNLVGKHLRISSSKKMLNKVYVSLQSGSFVMRHERYLQITRFCTSYIFLERFRYYAIWGEIKTLKCVNLEKMASSSFSPFLLIPSLFLAKKIACFFSIVPFLPDDC